MRKNRTPVFPLIIFFIILNGMFLTGSKLLERYGIDQSVLIIGNAILLAATLVSFIFAKRGLTSENPNAFVRSVYLSIMLKLFICVIAALVYIFINRNEINKPALFICMGLYLVYTFMEVSILTKLLKEKKHA